MESLRHNDDFVTPVTIQYHFWSQREYWFSNMDLQYSNLIWNPMIHNTLSRISYSSGSEPWLHVRITWGAFKTYPCSHPTWIQVNQTLQGWGQASFVDSDVHQGENHYHKGCLHCTGAKEVFKILYFSCWSNKSKKRKKEAWFSRNSSL